MTVDQTRPAGAGSDISVDHHSDFFREHNYALYDELIAKCPVAHSDQQGGVWFITGYEPVFEATLDDDLFRSAPGISVPPPVSKSIPIDTDPPETRAYRKVLLNFFSPDAANRLEPMVLDITTRLIDAFIERGNADLATELTTPVPAQAMLTLLGLDPSEWPTWITWIHGMVHERTAQPELAAEYGQQVFARIVAAKQERITGGVRGDMLSHLLQAEVDGRPLTDDEYLSYALLLLLAGLDTTAGFTGNALYRLVEQPQLRAQLLAQPELLRQATEEFLRHDTPTQALARTVSRDASFHGRQLHAGDKVLLMWAAANRDPAEFDNPLTIDFTRHPNRHLAFGVGQHRCLGSNMARMMFRVMVTQVLRRLPDYRLDGPVTRFADAAEVYGVNSMPVSFTPGPRIGSTP